mmetsp:Transcript_5788/g.11297  ORF Transcript_5788/g.11297 Transcript_5788/m.11297 type:complete len:556 (+) Transcript_5788:49-1716(+)
MTNQHLHGGEHQVEATPAKPQADHHGHGGGEMPFWAPPRQRQRWGEAQHDVHNNWGDIFYDLFFVALAYNLGNQLKEDPTWQGFLYFCGCFLPAIGLWHAKLYWDARFINEGDMVHNILELLIYLSLASAVQHVRPVAILSDVENNVDMFAFCLSLVLSHVLLIGRAIEVIVCVEVFHTKSLHEEAYYAMIKDLIWYICPALFYLAATIYSGIKYFRSSEQSPYGEEPYAEKSLEEGNDHRVLAGDSSSFYSTGSESDTAVWIVLAGAICSLVVLLNVFTLWMVWAKRADRMTKEFVPMNIGYGVHRYGEWTMLLLGESVLSLLIVDLSDGWSYYQTFFTGVLSVVLLEYLHFRSQPRDPDEHALRRGALNATCFSTIMYIYSIALVVLGTCYKMFLYEFVFENAGDRRFLSPIMERLLAGRESAALRFGSENRQQRIAHFFSASLTVVFASLDGMSISHKGITANKERCQCKDSKKLRASVLLLIIIRVVLVVFFATLSQYCTDPSLLSTLGFVGVILQLCVRAVGSFLFPVDKNSNEDEVIDRVSHYLNAIQE